MRLTLNQALEQIDTIKRTKDVSTSEAAKMFCQTHEVLGVSGKKLSPETLRVRFNEGRKKRKFVFGASKRLRKIEKSSARVAFLKLRLAILEDENLVGCYNDICHHISKIESQYA